LYLRSAHSVNKSIEMVKLTARRSRIKAKPVVDATLTPILEGGK